MSQLEEWTLTGRPSLSTLAMLLRWLAACGRSTILKEAGLCVIDLACSYPAVCEVEGVYFYLLPIFSRVTVFFSKLKGRLSATAFSVFREIPDGRRMLTSSLRK
jgi:hypothetical protein